MMEGLNAPVRVYRNGRWRLTHPQLREEPNATPSDVRGLSWVSDTQEWDRDGPRNRNMDTHNGTLFMAQTAGKFLSIDISDPDHPKQQDILELGSALGLRITDDGYAYVGPSYSGDYENDELNVIDVSDPQNMELVATVQSSMMDGGSHGMCLGPDQDWLYITTWGSSPTGVASVDISSRESPTFVDHVDYVDSHDIAVESSGNYAFVTTHETKMFSLNISDPSNMQVLDDLDYTDQWNGSGARLSEDENTFFFGAGKDPGYLFAIDVSDPYNLSEASRAAGGMLYRLRVRGDRVYGVTPGNVPGEKTPAVQVYDVSDPQNIEHLGYGGEHNDEGYIELELHPRTDHIYATGRNDQRERLTTLRPTYDRTLWESEMSNYVWALEASNDLAFFGDADNNFQAVDYRFGTVDWSLSGDATFYDAEWAGQSLFIADSDSVRRVSSARGESRRTHSEHTDSVWSVAFAETPGLAVSGDAAGTAIGYDFATETAEWTQPIGSGNVYGLDYDDTTGLVYAAVDNVIIALDPADGTEVWRHEQHTDGTRDVVSLNGVVFSASEDNTVIAYDPGTDPTGTNPGTTLWTHSHHGSGNQVYTLDASQDVVVSGGQDNRVVIVDRETGDEKGSHGRHSSSVISISIWNGVIVSGGLDNNVIAYG